MRITLNVSDDEATIAFRAPTFVAQVVEGGRHWHATCQTTIILTLLLVLNAFFMGMQQAIVL